MTHEKFLQILEARQEHKIVPGLDRILEHLALLGNPQNHLRVLHVAGTNGKGSSCAILESVLRASGYKTGFYLSPHLESPRERIRINGVWISEKDFARFLEKTLSLDSRKELTYFEILTSIAFQYFAQNQVEIAVIETGLGGRLDATNVVHAPLASIITSIDFDHMNWLGNTLKEIAREKAGIIKKNCPVFCSALLPEAMRDIQDRAQAQGSPLFIVQNPWTVKKIDWERNRQILKTPWKTEAALTLLGFSQGKNVALAEAVLSYLDQNGILNVSHGDIEKGLAQVSWPGRFEVLTGPHQRTAILDGGHNPEALRNFSKTWERSPWAKERALWVIGMMEDKDIASSLKSLPQNQGSVMAVSSLNPRAASAGKIAEIASRVFPKAEVAEATSLEEALNIWHNEDAPVVIVCGSLYLIEKARQILKKRGFENGKK